MSDAIQSLLRLSSAFFVGLAVDLAVSGQGDRAGLAAGMAWLFMLQLLTPKRDTVE